MSPTVVDAGGATAGLGPQDVAPSGQEGGHVLVPGSGEGAEEGGVLPSGPTADGSDTLSVGTPPSLFAEPGAAPPAVMQDLSLETPSDRPPGPATPPRQRLPAWIAKLFK